MDNLRLVLVFSLALVLLLIYQAWIQDYGNKTDSIDTTTSQTILSEKPVVRPDVPRIPTPSAAKPAVTDTTPASTAPIQPIRIQTDLLTVDISPKGGTVASVWLKKYPLTTEDPDVKFRLMKPSMPNLFIAQSGLMAADNTELPTHEALFTTSATNYQLEAGQTELTVELSWTGKNGVEVVKRYRFQRGSYSIALTQEVRNQSSDTVIARSYNQLQRSELKDPSAPRFVYTYTGGVYYGPDITYKKESFKDMSERRLDVTVTDGWIAMIQHYFLAAWVPPRGAAQTFYTNVLDGERYIIGKYSPPVSIASGDSFSFQNTLFAGPKIQKALEKLAPGLELTVDYGWLTVIAKPIHWLLDKIHAIVGNWGWSIVVLTLLIKLAFYKLSETSYKSMAHLRQVAPRLQALKDRYGDDKERLNQAMMELYKTEKINPLGGCLPIVVQIPVFIALYWVLLESVELRQAPFILWINDLSAPDPYFVLPLIMGVSMFIQQKLNPAPPDPMQAKLMMSLPFVFTVFFAFFPSGLVLYWTVNNVLSITQQWFITRTIEKAAVKRSR